jgi:hypothetical protein
MGYISQNAFAKLVGYPQPNVNRAVKQGKLVDEGHGIDPEHPTNAEWMRVRLERRAVKTQADAEAAAAATPDHGQAQPAPADPVHSTPHPPRSRGNKDFGANVSTANINRVAHADNERSKKTKADLEDLKYRSNKLSHLIRCGKAVELVEHNRSIGAIVAVVENHLRPFADRVSDQLEAMAKAGAGRAQFADFIDSEIDKALTAAQAARDHEIQNSEQRNIIDEIDLDLGAVDEVEPPT